MAVQIEDVGFSFIVDENPRFAYQGWHLAHSIIDRLHAAPSSIFVQFTSEVDFADGRRVQIIGMQGDNNRQIWRRTIL